PAAAGPAPERPASAAQRGGPDAALLAGDDPAGDLAVVLAWTKPAAARLVELEGDDERITGLAEEEAALATPVTELAGAPSALRPDAAEKFSRDVTEELSALAMPHASLVAVVQPLG